MSDNKKISKEVIDKYIKAIVVNDVEPKYTIKDKNIVLNNGQEISAEKMEIFYFTLNNLIKNPKEFSLNIWEKSLKGLLQICLALWIILTTVKILGGVEVFPPLTGIFGLINVAIVWAINVYYFMDDDLISRKRKLILDKVINGDSSFLIAALYNTWGENNTISKERNILGKATYKNNKLYLAGGLKIFAEDLNAFLKKMKWIED